MAEHTPPVLPGLAEAAADAVAEVENFWGSASTYDCARDTLWRLRRVLEREGVRVRPDGSEWRGGVLRALNAAGFHYRTDHISEGEFRLLLPGDKDQWHPTGPTLAEAAQAVRAQEQLRAAAHKAWAHATMNGQRCLNCAPEHRGPPLQHHALCFVPDLEAALKASGGAPLG